MEFKAKQTVNRGFSLIELLTAMGILSVLMLLMTSLMDEVQKSWRFGEDRLSQFREARVAFDLMTKNMSQATMNTYWDYEYTDAGNIKSYEKKSELHFMTAYNTDVEGKLGLSGKLPTLGHVVFFQAPLGSSVSYRNLSNLFNGRGYLVVHDSDEDFRPSFIKTDRTRFRLMEFRPPAEENQVFEDAIDEAENDQPQKIEDWWNQGLGGNFVTHLNPLAENIVLLVVSPMESLGDGSNRYEVSGDLSDNYKFDSADTTSSHSKQVPPLVRVVMVAIDESTAVLLEEKFQGGMPDIFPAGSLFRNVDNYNSDVEALIEHFNKIGRDDGVKINYRVFSTTVMLRAAKWLTAGPGNSSN
ncbi:MAG: Verru_Chthon cassette protein C [Verrucomicrobiales bacterium]|nr:Verru_Chthon cassette protein C [Verrucomicrobiales bacterium]